jgi:hypothetical protein
MDIMVDVDVSILERIVQVMKDRGIDRVDVKQESGPPTISLDGHAGLVEYKSLQWRYNVNPSIWKVSALRTILQRFDKCYRTIEDDETQSFSSQFSFYRITHPNVVQSAYFQLSPWVVYIHITSRGKLIPIEANGMCDELKKIYKDILQSFPPGRPMKQHLYEL